MPNSFVDIRLNLVYASGCQSRPVRPIWKVKRAPKRAYPSFRRFSFAIANHFSGDPDSNVKNANFFCGRPSRPCLCIRFAITARPTHLEANHFLGDPDSHVKNANFFCGRPSRPCLCIRLAITARPTHLEGQTSPEASIPLISMIFISTSKMPNFFVDVRQDLVKRAPKRAYPLFRRFSCGVANHFLGDPDSDIKNAKFFCGRPSRPSLCIQLAITARTIHLEGQTSPKASIPLISKIFVCYSKPFFG
uniref:Uncharacterized protein n=1 Tax=Solanum lycopersicum TaxID=4081 RepID=A0A494GA39_SOLLC